MYSKKDAKACVTSQLGNATSDLPAWRRLFLKLQYPFLGEYDIDFHLVCLCFPETVYMEILACLKGVGDVNWILISERGSLDDCLSFSRDKKLHNDSWRCYVNDSR